MTPIYFDIAPWIRFHKGQTISISNLILKEEVRRLFLLRIYGTYTKVGPWVYLSTE